MVLQRVILCVVLMVFLERISSQEAPPVTRCEQLKEKCEHRCIDTSDGARCLCNTGYMLKPDNRKCQDVDECRSDAPPCSQSCTNHPGGFSCECQDGYRMINETLCKAAGGGNPRLVYAKHAAIEILDLVTKKSVTINVPHQKVEQIGFYPRSNTVYWIDTLGTLGTVYRQQLEELPATPQPIINQGSGLNALVLDWVYALLYVAKGNSIIVCRINGRHCRTMRTSNNTITALAVDPSQRLLFFSELGPKPQISRISAGEAIGNVSANVVTTGNIVAPISIVLDNVLNRIYWADESGRVIEYCDAYEYNVNRKVLLRTPKPPLSITLFEDTIFWSDGGSIQLANKFTGQSIKSMVPDTFQLLALMMVHPVLQKQVPSPCSPTTCSQLCLPSKLPKGYVCACDDQSEIETDGMSCRMNRKSAHLLLSSGSQILGMDLHLTKSPDVLKEFPSEIIGDLAYDPVSDVVILVKTRAGTIEMWNPESRTDSSLLYDTMHMFVGGLTVDTRHGNVYWTLPQEGAIMAASIAKSQPVIVKELDGYPTVMAVAAELLFVADTENQCIYKMQLDGSDMVTLVSDTFPTAISISTATNALVWSDKQSETTRMIGLDGTNATTAQRFAQSYGALVLTDGKLYALPSNLTYLYAISDNGHGAAKHVPLGNFLSSGATVRHMALMPPTTTTSSRCRSNGSGCSHFCTTVNDFTKCLCPDGFSLKDGKTCEQSVCSHHSFLCQGKCIPDWKPCDEKPRCSGEDCQTKVKAPAKSEKTCSEHQFRCDDKNECIPNQWRCDDGEDCRDGSDERNCPDCEEGEWKCLTSNKCIPKRWLCNNRFDCDDHSDETEHMCKNATCNKSQFKCRYGACIELSYKCDEFHDCLDKSDEEACPKFTCDTFEFECQNGDCISATLTCNGRNECLNGEDEQLPECMTTVPTECACPNQTHFLCEEQESRCLPKVKKCNGVVDCPSGSDEYNCPSTCPDNLSLEDCKKLCQRNNYPFCHASLQDRPAVSWKASAACSQETWRCPKTGACVPLHDVCNEKPDCPDGEDEGPRCDTACESADCELLCRATPSGPRCICHLGFELGEDGKSCIDVDECSSYPGYCSQLCVNGSSGIPQCQCNTGYNLENDGKRCKAKEGRGPVLFALPQSIESISLSGHVLLSLVSVTESIITGLAYNAKKNLIYWLEVSCGITTVKTSNKNNASEDTELLSVNGVATALNYDWVNENLILATNVSKRFKLMVCSTASLQCIDVVTLSEGKEILSLAVDPRFGKLFWLEKNSKNQLSKVAIMSSDLKGSNIRPIIQDIPQASHLTVDTSTDKLFWSDSFLSSIHSADITGENQRLILTARNGLSHPGALAIFEDGIYFSNLDTLSEYTPAPDCIENTNLTVCNKFNGGDCKNLHQHYMGAHSIVIISKALQPDTFTVCKENGCPNVCVPSNSEAQCIKGKRTKRLDGCEVGEIESKIVTKTAPHWVATTAKPVPKPIPLLPRIVNNSNRNDVDNKSEGGNHAWVAGIIVPLLIILVAVVLAIIYRRKFYKPYGEQSRSKLFYSLRFGILNEDELQQQQECEVAEEATEKTDKRRKIYPNPSPSPMLRNFKKGRVLVNEA